MFICFTKNLIYSGQSKFFYTLIKVVCFENRIFKHFDGQVRKRIDNHQYYGILHLNIAQLVACGLYYKSSTIVIYDRNDIGQGPML